MLQARQAGRACRQRHRLLFTDHTDQFPDAVANILHRVVPVGLGKPLLVPLIVRRGRLVFGPESRRAFVRRELQPFVVCQVVIILP